jgi:hypothetical protein
MSIENTLAERGNRYGDFTDHARLCQDLKDVMTTFAVVQNTPNSVAVRCPWGDLPATHKQALEVIADKIARILSGDPNYADNWHDIQGYAKLVEDRLPKPEEPAAAIDDDSPRQQAVAQNGNTGEHYDELPVEGTPIDPADVDISASGSPNWKDAPDWANWLAQDGDGSWYWYEYPIYAREADDTWYEQKWCDGRIEDAGEDAERNPDWRNTRHARPTK